MIVRSKGTHFVCIRQQDHALVSGQFAAHLDMEIEPFAKTLYAISHHDIGWEELDRNILWDEVKKEPYSFDDYPLIPKLEAYTEGISRIEAHDAYAGFLVSKHFSSFFKDATEPAARKFVEQEWTRQNKLREHFTEEEEKNIARNFRILKFCDDLSLALCLNEPCYNTHPWFKDGILFQGERVHWIWETTETIRIQPNWFKHSFTIEIPYEIYDSYHSLIGRETYRFLIKV